MPSLLSPMSSNMLLDILKQSGDATAIYTGADLIIQLANDAMLRIWGKDTSVHGKRFEDALPEMKGQPFTELLKNVWLTGEKYEAKNMEATIELKGVSRTSHFDFIYNPVKDASGNVSCILHTAVDVSERVAAWRLVREKEEREQLINEQLEAANEEYRSTNEDLAVLNEEYQATNEELNEVNDRCQEIYDQLVFTEHRMQQLIRSSPIGLTLLRGRQMIIETANPQMLEIWGTSENLTLGRPLLEVFPILADQDFSEKLNLVYLSGLSVSVKEISNVSHRIAGQVDYAFLDIDFHPLLKPDGTVDAVMATVVDVTGQALARQELQENEWKLQEANEELVVLNEEYQTTNEGLATLNEEYNVTNEQLELANQNVNLLNETLEKRNTDLHISNSGHKELNIKLDDTISSLTESNAKLTTLNGIISELNTKLGNNEQRLQGILDTMAEGVGVIDLNGKLVYANPKAQEILGLTQSEINDRIYDDPRWQNLRLDGSPLPQEEHPMYIMMTTGRPVYDHEISVQPQGRDRFYISINAAPIFDDDGNLTGGIGTFMDVTTRRLIANGKDDFISIASHELKTPVTSLKASLQLLQRSHHKLPEELREKLINQAVRNLESLSGLISNLLDTSRMEQGQLKLEKTSFLLTGLFDDCRSHILENTDHILILKGDTDFKIEADHQQIGQVLMNFINNAIKYAPDSKQIILRSDKLSGTEVRLSVSDFGPGIPQEKLSHLFERYYRTEHKGQKFSGLGLGLYISAEIIRNHDGNIGVDSEIGQGSEFWFTLPIDNQTIKG